MRFATIIAAVGLLVLLPATLVALAGCASHAGRDALPGPPPVRLAVDVSSPPTLPDAARIPIYPPGEGDAENERQIQAKLPHGPADPQYVEPELHRVPPGLAVSIRDGFHVRHWQPQGVTYASGAIVHPPLWFYDPMESSEEYRGLGEIIPLVYSPIRFAVNLVALPISAVVHPAWEPTVTDAGPVFIEPTIRPAPATQGD